MALLKDLIVTGASKFIGDAYFATIKTGTWNGSVITEPYLPDATTSAQGVVQLTDSTSSTSTTTAATPNSVKSAYDLANGKWTYNETTIKAVKVNASTASDTVSTVTKADNASYYLTFVDSDNATAAQESIYTDGGISYNPSTNKLTASVVYKSETVSSALDDLIGKVFPLECTFGVSGNGTYEMGKSTTLSVYGDPKQRGNAVTPSTLTWTSSINNSSYTTYRTPTQTTTRCTYALAADSSGSGQLRVRVTDGTTTLYSSNYSYSHTYYRYYGFCPISIDTSTELANLIEAMRTASISNGTNITLTVSGSSVTIKSPYKELSTSKTVTARNIPAGCNMFVVVNASSAPTASNNLGNLEGCTTGTISVKRVNDANTSDTMQFIIIPGKSSATVDNIKTA